MHEARHARTTPRASSIATMSESPIDRLLGAVGRFDVDGATALLAPDVRFLTADGRRSEGRDATRALLDELLGELRSATYRVTGQWHEDDAWIAEVQAEYELHDGMRTAALPRAFVLRDGPQGLTGVHVYGAHEHRLDDDEAPHGMRIGGRWIPPL
jgi:hypothetical protein